MEFIKKHKKVWVFVAFIVLALTINAAFGWTDILSTPEGLPVLQRALQENFFGAILLYIAVTIVACVVLALPGIIFAAAAGAMFGPVWGTIACCLATTLGASLAFLAGRYFLRDSIKPLLMKNKYIRRLLFEESGKSDVFLLMITRLIPLFPYNLQNFAYGITDIGFWPFTIYSLVFMLPGTAAYTIAAAGIADRENRILYFVMAAGLLVALLAVSMTLKKRTLEKGTPAEEDAPLKSVGRSLSPNK